MKPKDAHKIDADVKCEPSNEENHTSLKGENDKNGDDVNGTSAKQHKMQQQKCDEKSDEVTFSYTWTQTETDVAVTLKHGGMSVEQTQAFDVSFTSNDVNITAGDRSHVIQFYGAIQKEESRVQATKGSIVLRVQKQNRGMWPQLEAVKRDAGSIIELPKKENGEVIDEADSGVSSESNSGNKEIHDNSSDIKEKEEEPVFKLSHLKNDFYERGLLLTLRVYAKSLNKDAVNITFSKKGFIFKFQTSDAKFLQLHEGTTSETAFTWPVTTRQDIVPEECKFTVKSTVVEIMLKKTSTDRWASLEAPLRKDKPDNCQSDSWIPINGGTSTFSPQTPSPSSITSKKVLPPEEEGSGETQRSNIAFDDLGDINVRQHRSGVSNVFRDQQEEEDDEDDNSSAFTFDYSRKPTAKVSPLNNQTSESGMVISPGYAGLVNIGNTCFMNCVIQVLANTREFRDFFLDGRYEKDINEDNPLGMKGQLAATYGVLLRWLWSCKKSCWDPRRLKDLISKKNPQFFGYAQHDAHEFLAFLLDGLHEDLNRIRKKPYTETIDSNGRPDKVVADEAWGQYKLRNDSVVVDLFQGQFKSKLVCPQCGKVSITFDPFLYMSVPLPKKKKVIPVNFIWKESYKKPVKYLIQVSQDSTVEKLKEELYHRTHVRPRDIRVFEAYRGKILKFFISGSTLANIEQKDIIVACEVLSEEVAGEDVIEIPVMQRKLFPTDYPSSCAFCHKPCQEGSPLKRCSKCYKVGYCDHQCQRNHWNVHKSKCSSTPDPIGCPYIMSVPASRSTYSYLVKHMEEFARFSVDIFQPPVKSSSTSTPSGGAETPDTPPGGTNVRTHLVSSPAMGVSTGPQLPTGMPGSLNPPISNLSSCSLSQSSSSLNSLDSLSSASSTCTLTGENSDTPIGGGGGGGSDTGHDSVVSPRYVSSSHATCSDSLFAMEGTEANRSVSVDSGFESIGSKAGEKSVPVTSVLGVQAAESERDKATPKFFIKPVSMEGVGLKGAERLEDKGDVPLELASGRFLSMDWRNNEKLPSYVLVQSKDLECVEVDNLNNLAASGKSNLYHCLEMFTEPEVLSPEEAWYCPSCKKHVEASKQMSIWKLPHTLVIQLKRFSFQNFLNRSKIKKHVDFPTRGLDLSHYCVGLQPEDPPPIYDLYGVANHHGLLIGGHYTSYVRCSGLGRDVGASDEIGWRLCNDSRVMPVASEMSVVTPDAYLLFYRRRCPASIGPTSSIPPVITQPSSSSPHGSSSKSQLIMDGNPAARITKPSLAKRDSIDSDEEMLEENVLPCQSRKKPLQSKESSLNANLQRQIAGEAYSSLSSGASASSCYSGEDFCNIPISSPSFGDIDAPGFSGLGGEAQGPSRFSEETEKGDEEKAFWDCNETDKQSFQGSLGLNAGDDIDNDIDEDDDDEDKERLVIDTTEPDLGYTDMEAVD